MKFFILGLFCFTLSACSEADGLANVQKYYETFEVVMIPGKPGCFIARKPNGSIWYAFSCGFGEGIIDQVQLMPSNLKEEPLNGLVHSQMLSELD